MQCKVEIVCKPELERIEAEVISTYLNDALDDEDGFNFNAEAHTMAALVTKNKANVIVTPEQYGWMCAIYLADQSGGDDYPSIRDIIEMPRMYGVIDEDDEHGDIDQCHDHTCEQRHTCERYCGDKDLEDDECDCVVCQLMKSIQNRENYEHLHGQDYSEHLRRRNITQGEIDKEVHRKLLEHVGLRKKKEDPQSEMIKRVLMEKLGVDPGEFDLHVKIVRF